MNISTNKHFNYADYLEIKPESYQLITPNEYSSDIKRIASIHFIVDSIPSENISYSL